MHAADEITALRAFAERSVGPLAKVADVSRKFGRKSVTWRVVSEDGGLHYLKRHEYREHYAAEVRALERWAPAVPKADWWQAPRVVAASDELGAVVLSGLPGQIVDGAALSPDATARAYRLAGRFASRLHGSAVDLSGETKVQAYGPTFVERTLALAAQAVDKPTLAWVESVVSVPGIWDGLEIVPTHCDYSPRNWLVKEGESWLGVIDWERSRPGYWVEDFQRMVMDHWVDEPRLKEAFFEGYGREPSAREWRQAELVNLLNAVGGIPWASSHGDMAFEQHNRAVVEALRRVL